jgi:hypothetical protein
MRAVQKPALNGKGEKIIESVRGRREPRKP